MARTEQKSILFAKHKIATNIRRNAMPLCIFSSYSRCFRSFFHFFRHFGFSVLSVLLSFFFYSFYSFYSYFLFFQFSVFGFSFLCFLFSSFLPFPLFCLVYFPFFRLFCRCTAKTIICPARQRSASSHTEQPPHTCVNRKILHEFSFPIHVAPWQLILDLDETLVHSAFKPVTGADYVIDINVDGTRYKASFVYEGNEVPGKTGEKQIKTEDEEGKQKTENKIKYGRERSRKNRKNRESRENRKCSEQQREREKSEWIMTVIQVQLEHNIFLKNRITCPRESDIWGSEDLTRETLSPGCLDSPAHGRYCRHKKKYSMPSLRGKLP